MWHLILYRKFRKLYRPIQPIQLCLLNRVNRQHVTYDTCYCSTFIHPHTRTHTHTTEKKKSIEIIWGVYSKFDQNNSLFVLLLLLVVLRVLSSFSVFGKNILFTPIDIYTTHFVHSCIRKINSSITIYTLIHSHILFTHSLIYIHSHTQSTLTKGKKRWRRRRSRSRRGG